MKKYLRKVHINEEKWIWYVKGNADGGGNLIIISPNKIRTVINVDDFHKWKRERDSLTCKGIGPGEVKLYVQENIIPLFEERI